MDDKTRVRVGTGYPLGQLARALTTATVHEDPATRRRAEERVRRWEAVLAGMATGTLAVGSRTPVKGLPAWVTLEVVRGGFATGEAVAGGPLRDHETDLARRVGLPAERRALFAYHLTERGMAELGALLDTGRYRVEIPEEAALPVVAWLLRAGDRSAALDLLDELAPFADRLRFAPAPGEASGPDPAGAPLVHRETVGEVRAAVAGRRPNERVEAMREALTVWAPFGDELLALWLETVADGRVASHVPAGWVGRGAALLDRYRALAAIHTRCAKHRRPKENLAILRSCLQDAVAGRPLDARRRGLLQHAVDSMVRRRGRPGSEPHAALRARQAEDAARPTHHALARIVAVRLAELPQAAGVRATEPLTRAVRPEEAATTGLPAGTEIPEPIRQVVDRALAAPIEQLVERGIVPSAEVLAELVPQLAAATTAMAYRDQALRRLMAATYEAFRRRRSLLLLNLEHQARLEELPWVAAVAGHADGDGATSAARSTLWRMGELTLDTFPATVVPNRLVRELDALARSAYLDLPLVEELAADIFMGTFSAKFLRAAKVAGELLGGSLYERYYGIDYASVLAIEDPVRPRRALRLFTSTARTSAAFDDLCHERARTMAGVGDGERARVRSWVAVNGAVVEQAQILTTQNLATLVARVEVTPATGWAELASRCFVTVCRLVARAHRNPRPLPVVKDAAYAWRNALFFASLTGSGEQVGFEDRMHREVRAQPAHVRAALAPVLTGFAHVRAGGGFDRHGEARGGRRFLGWAPGGHWMLRPPGS